MTTTNTTLCLCHWKTLTSYGYFQASLFTSNVTFNVTTLNQVNMVGRSGIATQILPTLMRMESRKEYGSQCSSMTMGPQWVPVCKALQPDQKKAKLRVCGDYSVTVNAQLETHHHPMLHPDNLICKLGGSYYFTKIDLSNAYSQIKLAPESQKRLALSTHRCVPLQTRLPFGISSAPGYS